MAFISTRQPKPKVADLHHEIYARREPTTEPTFLAEYEATPVAERIMPLDVQVYSDREATKPIIRYKFPCGPSKRAKSLKLKNGSWEDRYRLVWLPDLA